MRIWEHVIVLAGLLAPPVALAADPVMPLPRQSPPLADAPESSESSEPPESPWSGHIALGGMMMPDFPGSKDYQYLPLVMAKLAYRDFYAEAMGPRAKINLVPGGRIEAGPLVAYDGGRDHDVDNRRVGRLPEVKSTIELGGFAQVNFAEMLMKEDSLSFGVEFAQALESHEGYTINLQTSYGIQMLPFMVSIDLGAQYADKDYAEAYFGVDSVGSAASGLPMYSASAGATTLEAGLNIQFGFSPNWGIMSRVSYGRLIGDAADSPIVKEEGSANQFSAGLAVMYRF